MKKDYAVWFNFIHQLLLESSRGTFVYFCKIYNEKAQRNHEVIFYKTLQKN